MKKVILGLVAFSMLFLIQSKSHEVSANDKFKGNEKYYLDKCAQRLNEEEAIECSEFKVYYQSLGNSAIEDSRNLASQIETLKQDLDRLTEKSNELSAQIKELQEQKAIIENNITVINDNVVAIQEDIEELKLRIEARQAEIKKRMQDNQLFVNGNRKFSFILESSNFSFFIL